MATQGHGVGELLAAMGNPDIRFIAAFTLAYTLSGRDSFFYTTTPQALKQQFEAVVRSQREIASRQLLHRLAESRNNLDDRRAALYVLGQLAMETEPATQAEIARSLKAVLKDEGEAPELRWMAAVGLERNGMPMGTFFQKNGLADPRENPSLRLKPDRAGDRWAPSLDFDVFAGQYIYNRNPPCGGGIVETYNALRNLMSKSGSSRQR